MNPVKIKATTSIKIMVQLGQKTENIIGVLRNVYGDNSLKKSTRIEDEWIGRSSSSVCEEKK